MSEKKEACCPECHVWSPVSWDDSLPPGGLWWSTKSPGCPVCGKTVCVESECDFRIAKEAPRNG